MTEHFSFDELTNTSHTELLEKNRSKAKSYMKQLQKTAEMAEQVRSVLGVPLTVSSGFRCKQLNSKVGGSKTSSHMIGACIDVVPKGLTVKESIDILIENADKLPLVYKAIMEGIKGKEWLHLQSQGKEEKPQEFYATVDGKQYTRIA